MRTFRLNVNGREHEASADPDKPLLYVLRDDLQLHGPKFGCGLSQCGACDVLVDGKAVRSCVYPVAKLGSQRVITVEGLPKKIADAFVAEQAAQCGYCIPGMMIATAALLREKPRPTEADIRRALGGNLCRCGTHLRIIRAVKRAAGEPV